MAKRHGPRLHVLVLIATAAAMAGCVATACWRPMGVKDSVASWTLEIANESGRLVRVEISMISQYFSLPSATRGGKYGPTSGPTSGIIVLESGERRTVRMTTGRGSRNSLEDNRYVADFQQLMYYAESDRPYRSYAYRGHRCSVGAFKTCVDARDDTLWIHERSDGTEERLFVKSPERPFYLERDKQDGDLARIVITFVPSPDEVAGDGG